MTTNNLDSLKSYCFMWKNYFSSLLSLALAFFQNPSRAVLAGNKFHVYNSTVLYYMYTFTCKYDHAAQHDQIIWVKYVESKIWRKDFQQVLAPMNWQILALTLLLQITWRKRRNMFLLSPVLGDWAKKGKCNFFIGTSYQET